MNNEEKDPLVGTAKLCMYLNAINLMVNGSVREAMMEMWSETLPIATVPPAAKDFRIPAHVLAAIEKLITVQAEALECGKDLIIQTSKAGLAIGDITHPKTGAKLNSADMHAEVIEHLGRSNSFREEGRQIIQHLRNEWKSSGNTDPLPTEVPESMPEDLA